MTRNDNLYLQRKELLDFVSGSSQINDDHNPIKLDHLIGSLREKSKSDDVFASLYFAGSVGDHPYFIQNDKFALGISILPEDSKKAGVARKHPNQIEVVFVLEGSLIIEYEHNNCRHKKILQEGESFTIMKNCCHRIRQNNDQIAAFLFVKTNPAIEPRGLECNFNEG